MPPIKELKKNRGIFENTLNSNKNILEIVQRTASLNTGGFSSVN